MITGDCDGDDSGGDGDGDDNVGADERARKRDK